MQRPSSVWSALVLVGTAACAWAADDGRAAIAAERAAILQRFTAEEARCSDRFAVTACVEDVHARRRQALAPLREQELRLAAEQRQQRADRRRESREARNKATAQHADAASAPPRPGAVAPQPHAVHAAHPPPSTAVAAAEAAQRVQAAERRRQASLQAQERIAHRMQEHSGRGRAAQPLPAPPAASAGGR